MAHTQSPPSSKRPSEVTQPASAGAQQLGALDLGSNSFHLLVATENQGRIQVLDKHKEMVRLAEGLNGKGKLDRMVVKRALDCLERFAQRLRPLQPQNVRIVGTNTLRKAQDASDFIEKAEAVLGHSIEIISGREEARLIYLGVCHDLGDEQQSRLVVDIGGGSTELILGRHFTPESLESLYIGCVSLSQRFFADGKITKVRWTKAINEALLELEPISQDFKQRGWESCIGASGTINAVASVVNAMQGSRTITQDGIDAIKTELISAGHVEKLTIPGLAEERKTVFPGGVAIVAALFTALEIESMSPSQGALREGLIYDLLGRQHQSDIRDQTVLGLMRRHNVDESQARQVRDTTMGLLSQVAVDWGLTESEHNLMLGWAANLHEIGMDVSHAGYHKHGGYLIENMDMPGFSRSSQQMLAMLVRNHRRKLQFSDSPEPDLVHLTVLLRLSALLHRSRSHDPLPHIQLRAEKSKLTLSAPKKWLAEHPLTALDLDNEAHFINAAGIELNVKTHS